MTDGGDRIDLGDRGSARNDRRWDVVLTLALLPLVCFGALLATPVIMPPNWFRFLSDASEPLRLTREPPSFLSFSLQVVFFVSVAVSAARLVAGRNAWWVPVTALLVEGCIVTFVLVR